jgi:hypothetical protein
MAAIGEAMAEAGDRLEAGDFDWEATREANLVGSATTVFTSTTRVLDMVPSKYDYAYGGTFLPSLATLAIPRIIWPEKPLYLPARDFAIKFWGVASEEELGTSIGIGMPAESYYNFGWLGLALFPLFGVLLRFLTERVSGYSQGDAVDVVRHFFILFVIARLTPALLYFIGGGIRQLVLYVVFASLVTAGIPRIREPGLPRRELAPQ